MGTDYENVSAYATHIEDPGPSADHPRPESVEKGAGDLEVGFLIDGAKFVLFRGPAGRFLKDQRLAKEKAEAEQQTQANAQPTPSY